MNMNLNTNEILTTTEYDMFRKISNRKITENPKLEEELLSEGQRQPILVNEKNGSYRWATSSLLLEKT